MLNLQTTLTDIREVLVNTVFIAPNDYEIVFPYQAASRPEGLYFQLEVSGTDGLQTTPSVDNLNIITDTQDYAQDFILTVEFLSYRDPSGSAMQELRQSFKLPAVREGLIEKNIGFSKVTTFNVLHSLLSTKWEERAVMECDFFVTDCRTLAFTPAEEVEVSSTFLNAEGNTEAESVVTVDVN